MIKIENTLKTSVTYNGTGTQTHFDFPFDYLRKSFVHVSVNNALMNNTTDYTIDGRTVVFNNAPASGSVIRIYRETTTDRLVVWADASVLKATDMTIQQVQQLHILEEANDWTKSSSIVLNDEGTAWQGRNYRLTNISDPVNEQDAVTKRYIDNEENSFMATMNALKNQTEQMANQTSINANKAKKSEANAKLSEQNAKRSETLSKTSELAAKDSETNAKLSETIAKTSADSAGASKEAAQSAATTASNFASAASNSASEAKRYENEANSYAENAKEYAATATTKASETTAKVIEATDEANRAKAEADRAKSISNNIGNPVSDVTENNGTVTVTKSNGTQSTFMAFPQGENGALPIANGGTGASTAKQARANLEVEPIGTIYAFAGNNIPKGYLPCNGSAISRTTYADLFAVIGTTYGAGDGSTTFNLPNLTDKFIQGSDTAGTVKSAGLPNITGVFSTYNDVILSLFNNINGCFTPESRKDSSLTYDTLPVNTSQYAGHYCKGGIFNASNSNSIYGNSDTVQPPALTMRYIIKY